MKALVTEVLGLDEFNETVMDEHIEFATILDNTVTFHFRDGREVSKPYLDKRHGVKWTEERRAKAVAAINASWTEERRKKHGEIIREVRRNQRAKNSDHDTGDDQPIHGIAD